MAEVHEWERLIVLSFNRLITGMGERCGAVHKKWSRIQVSLFWIYSSLKPRKFLIL